MNRLIPLAAVLLSAAAAAVLGGCSSGDGYSLLSPKTRADVLAEAFKSPESDVRRKAMYEMSRWKEHTEDHVTLVGLALLGEPDMMTRAQAAQTLGAWGDAKGVFYLAVTLGGKRAGSEAATKTEQDFVLPEFPDGSKFVRLACAKALGRIGAGEAVLSLAHGLRSDGDVDVRIECARSLRRQRQVDAARALLIGLIDSDLAVRVTATESLEYMTGRHVDGGAEAWSTFLAEAETPLAGYGHPPKRKPSKPDEVISEEKKQKIREILSDLFPLERREGPFD